MHSRPRAPYMLVGSYSSNYYGVSRATHDANFVVQATPDALLPLFAALKDWIRFDPQVAFESVTGTSRHIGRMIERKFRVEIFYLSDDAHDRARFERRKNWPYIESWCDQHGTHALLDEVRRSIPPIP